MPFYHNTYILQIIAQRRKFLNKIIEETKNNNKNIDMNYDTFIEDKLAGGCLLDRLILSISPNGDPMKDEIINEEITLTLFTVIFFIYH